jgi:hypothetical protein
MATYEEQLAYIQQEEERKKKQLEEEKYQERKRKMGLGESPSQKQKAAPVKPVKKSSASYRARSAYNRYVKQVTAKGQEPIEQDRWYKIQGYK